MKTYEDEGEVLTKSQDQRRKKKTLVELKKLLAMREVKDLLDEIDLGSYRSCTSDPYSDDGNPPNCFLYLTRDGLEEQRGRGGFRERKVRPTIELIENYGLAASEICDLIIKLKA